MKAARVRSAAQVQALQPFHTDFHLLDAYSPRAPGGTGESFDWALARLHPGHPPLVLSGGLTPDNVGAAIAAVRPFAVDTASGTEAAPGRKDPAKLTAFFRAGAPPTTRSAPADRRMSSPPLERRFGPYGGRYVPETLIPALDELERAWLEARADPAFNAELDGLLRDYVGRPTPLYRAPPPVGGRRAARSGSSART